MISLDDQKQLRMLRTSLKADILWYRRTSTTPSNISFSLISVTGPVSGLRRLLSLLLVPLAGASGGTLYCLTADQLRHVGSTEELLASFISLLF